MHMYSSCHSNILWRFNVSVDNFRLLGVTVVQCPSQLVHPMEHIDIVILKIRLGFMYN